MPPKSGMGKQIKKSGKAEIDASKPKKRGREKGSKGKKRKESYAIYIYKVLKQVHPDTGISSKVWFVSDCYAIKLEGSSAYLVVKVCGNKSVFLQKIMSCKCLWNISVHFILTLCDRYFLRSRHA